MSMTILDLDNVSVRIPIYDVGSMSIRRDLMHLTTGGRVCQEASKVYVVEALSEVSLSLRSGDRLAIVGRNGSGKSTILRLMAGIYQPSAGRIQRVGRVSSLLDMGCGLSNEASGYRNMITLGLMLGLSYRDIRKRTDEIADFTELGQYLDMPVRTYSSGMRLRLAFAVATCVTPDILLLDEVIGVGDQHFMVKAQQRLMAMASRAAICVITAHWAEVLMDICNRGLTLEKGRVVDEGPIAAVVERYGRSAAASEDRHAAA